MRVKLPILVAGVLVLPLLTVAFYAKRGGPESLADTINALDIDQLAGSASRGSSGLFTRDGVESVGFSKHLPSHVSRAELERDVAGKLERLGWVRHKTPVGVKDINVLGGESALWQRDKQLMRVQLAYSAKTGRTAYFWLQRSRSLLENWESSYQAWRANSRSPSTSRFSVEISRSR